MLGLPQGKSKTDGRVYLSRRPQKRGCWFGIHVRLFRGSGEENPSKFTTKREEELGKMFGVKKWGVWVAGGGGWGGGDDVVTAGILGAKEILRSSSMKGAGVSI